MPPGLRVTHPERHVVQQQRAALRPRPGPVGLEHDRGEHLDPVHHQRPVACQARLPIGAGAQPLGALARRKRSVAIGRAAAHHHKRLGDPARDELVAARCMRTLMQPDLTLAQLAVVMPGLLARQRRGEGVAAVAVGRGAPIQPPTMPVGAVMTIEADPRPCMLRSRTDRFRFAPALALR